MGVDYDVRIKSLFDRAEAIPPDEKFIREVMKNIGRQERMKNLFRLACLAAVIPFLWVLSPDMESLLENVNGLVESASNSIAVQVTEACLSPATWMFLIPALAYILYHNRRRLI